MPPIRSASVFSLLLLTFSILTLSSFAQNPPDRLHAAIDVNQVVPLRGNVPSLALAQFDRGQVEDSHQLPFVVMMFKPSPNQQSELTNLLADQQDPTSPSYHKWLTPEQFGLHFGLSTHDLAKIEAWLRSQGFRVIDVPRSHNWIAFNATAGQAQLAFRTAIHRYDVNGEIHVANATDPFIPRDLQEVVTGIWGLNDFKPRALRRETTSFRRMGVHARPDYNSGGANFLAPDDLATIYDIKSLLASGFDGTGMTLAILGQSDINLSDINQFRKAFGLSTNPPQIILTGSDPGQTGDQGEADLDLEWAGAVARNATILYVNSTNVFNSALYAISHNLAPVISMSFGLCEQLVVQEGGAQAIPSFEQAFQQANTQGITFLAASGDTGAAGCDTGMNAASMGFAVSYPASSPEVTGVGGSTFNEQAGVTYWAPTNGTNGESALMYIPETSWNDSQLTTLPEASGGGKSSCITISGQGCAAGFPKPSWQTGPGVPADGVRDVPDITMDASPNHDGYIYCQLNLCANGIPAPGPTTIVGGTSASTPVFAGLLTILNQYLVKQKIQSSPGLGNVNAQLYTLAAGSNATSLFHDIKSGDNKVPCQAGTPSCPTTGTPQFGYSATTGYDYVTGLGSVDASALITGWAATGSFSMSASPNSLIITRGNSGQSTITLVASAGSTNLPAMTLACPTTPPITESTCSFSPATVTPTTSGAQSVVTITTTAPSGALRDPLGRQPQILYAMLLPGAFGALLVAGRKRRNGGRLRVIGFGILLLLAVASWTSCGGGGSSTKNAGSTPVGQAVTMTITASATGFSQTVPLTVTLQ